MASGSLQLEGERISCDLDDDEVALKRWERR